MALITERVALARNGANDKVICRMPSGWAVMGDVQFLPGYCLLVPDPVEKAVPYAQEVHGALRRKIAAVLGEHQITVK